MSIVNGVKGVGLILECGGKTPLFNGATCRANQSGDMSPHSKFLSIGDQRLFVFQFADFDGQGFFVAVADDFEGDCFSDAGIDYQLLKIFGS